MRTNTKSKVLAGLGVLGALASILSLLLYLKDNPDEATPKSQSTTNAVRENAENNDKPTSIDISGNENTVVSDINGDVTINNVNSKDMGTFINNPAAGSALLLSEPNIEAKYHICLATKGTKVEKLETQKDSKLPLVWMKIKIMAGEYKGKVGWVSQNNLEER